MTLIKLASIAAVAAAKGLYFVSVPVEQAAQLDRALTDLTQLQHDALMLINDPVFLTKGDRILAYCSERRLPTMFNTAAWVISGGLMAYEPQAIHMYRRADCLCGQNPGRGEADGPAR